MAELNLKFLKNLTVLYVEDDLLIASQTAKLLETFFARVVHCTDAESALKLYQLDLVHVVITDIALPGMSGLELCGEIRKRDRHIPILITTIYRDTEHLQQAIKLNLVDYLIKPVSILSITQALYESLERMKENGYSKIELKDKIYYFPMLGQLEVEGNLISLTSSELALLNLLIHHKNQVVRYDMIEYTLNPKDPMSESAFKNLIYRLRKKIGKESIVAVSGVGIKLVASA